MDNLHHHLVEQLPEDHFGKVVLDVINALTKGRNCSVYGIPGYGMEFFAKQVGILLIRTNPELKVVLLNSSDDFFSKKKDIIEYLASYFFIEKPSYEKINHFLNKNKVVIIVGEVLTSEHKDLF